MTLKELGYTLIVDEPSWKLYRKRVGSFVLHITLYSDGNIAFSHFHAKSREYYHFDTDRKLLLAALETQKEHGWENAEQPKELRI